ncbi:MAG TPA: hypothetical protein VJ553_01045 [Candidatus Paceibacterota bacterium]|nr:hypothetical protein [Candidatus Paceibacterota bacterium]
MPKTTRTFPTLDAFIDASWGKRPRMDKASCAYYDTIVGRLRKLDSLVRPAIGQLAIMIKRDERFYGCTGFGYEPRDEDYSLDTHLKMCVLREPGLVLEETESGPLISLAAAQHVSAWYGLGDWRTELRLGPIREDPIWTFWRGLDVPMKLRNSLNQLGNPVHIEVLAGDQNVIAWASRGGSRAKLVHRMARMLGRDLSFPALTEELTYERGARIRAIDALWLERATLKRRIDAIMDAGRRGVGAVSLDGVSVTLCEDDDDARIITIADRERLRIVEANLREHLGSLRELGVDDSTPNIHLVRHVAQQLGVPLA